MGISLRFIVILTMLIASATSACYENFCCLNVASYCNQCAYDLECSSHSSFLKINVQSDVSTNITKLEIRSHISFLEIHVENESKYNINQIELLMPNISTTKLYINKGSYRSISVITNYSKLTFIDFSTNKIDKIDNKIFSKYSTLVDLRLNRNEIKEIEKENFNGLEKLESLDLSENKLVRLKNAFVFLKNLQHLNLSWNGLDYLHESNFENGLLQQLDVSHNQLKEVSTGAFQYLPNLARLLIADNPNLGASEFDTQLLVATGQRLQQIDASRTGLQKVPEAFTHSIRFLSLSGNRIIIIESGDLESYPLLQTLDFSQNEIGIVQDDALGRLEMLLFLTFNKNVLSNVPKMLPHELKYLSLNHNLLANLTVSDFKNLPNLRILLLNNNRIIFIQEKVFEELMSLEVLDLSNNPIQILTTSSLAGPTALRDLRLCYLNVSLPKGDGNFPLPLPETLEMLHLQSSPSLANHLLEDSAILAALSHLQYLDLRMNNLTEVRNDLLYFLGQLNTLRLHGNGFNCSGEEWLMKWMVWNNSIVKKEPCYYSNNDDRKELVEQNCTFSETFTISDNLPPVNLYTTEMINKLLSYYGFLSNATEANLLAHKNSIEKTQKNTKQLDSCKETNCFNKMQKTIEVPNILTNEIKTTDRKDIFLSSKGKDVYGHELYNPTRTERQPDLLENNMISSINKVYTKTNLESISKKSSQDDNVGHLYPYFRKYRNKSGKTINKEKNTEKGRTINLIKQEPETMFNQTSMSFLSLINSENTTNAYKLTTARDKSEFSPYQSASSSYGSYIGIVAVVTLIVCCLVLWASLRLRYRKRGGVSVSENEGEDQIEVANISGGVLW